MKKLVSMILILCMACMLIPAMAEEDLTGEWYASYAGVAMTMNINADGTLTMTIPGMEEPAAGTWTLDGDQIVITVQDSPASGTVTAEGIALSESGMELLFTREPVESISVADVKADAAEEEFYGEYACTYIGSQGILMDASAMGMAFGLKISEGALEFTGGEDDLYAMIFTMMGLTGTYADGKIDVVSTMEGNDATGTIELLEDGMVKLSLNSNGEIMVIYLAPAAAEEAPAA